MCMWVQVPVESKRGLGSLLTGVICGYEPSEVGAWTWTWVFCKSSTICWTTSLAPWIYVSWDTWAIDYHFVCGCILTLTTFIDMLDVIWVCLYIWVFSLFYWYSCLSLSQYLCVYSILMLCKMIEKEEWIPGTCYMATIVNGYMKIVE